MAITIDRLSFYSKHAIDKVVTSGNTSVVNSGATSHPQVALIVSSAIANPYGRRALVRGAYSIDGGANYQSLDSRLIYTFNLTVPGPSTEILNGLQAAISIGVSDSLITFRTANGYHGDVTDDGVNYIYTPISLTFLIKYAVFERE